MSLKLPNISVAGSSQSCGKQYGIRFSDKIRGFLDSEIGKINPHLRLVRSCLLLIKKHAPNALEFLMGVTKGSGISFDEALSLSLHEEIIHKAWPLKPHCTGILLSDKSGTFTGLNWDWPPSMFDWPGVLHMSIFGKPKIVAYHYPGLWNCCGINSEGLSLVWTGGGYFPPVKPTKGVPTYILIHEILLKKSVEEALEYLKETPRAGSFIFLIADKSGKKATIEATPRKISLEEETGFLYRANLYCNKKIVGDSKQQLPNKKKHHSVGRMKRVRELSQFQTVGDSKRSIQRILLDPSVQVAIKGKAMTIDSIVCDCQEKVMYIKRGGNDRNPWNRYKV